ncbi:APC family permease, partial [Candidatus Bathyarchaeota archaeon]|nr:APC family permease [Candidatus Bathyarchaeota archaeon]
MVSKPPLFVRKATGLTREISVLSTIPLSWLCIGAGINLFSVQASYSFAGANVPFGYFLCGIFYVIFTTCLGLMAVAMPRTGGDYVSTGRILGPFAGIFSGIGRVVGLAFIGGLLGGVTGILTGVGLLQAGTLANNATWIDWGLWILQNKEVQFGIGILLILISFLILMVGSRVFMWATWILVVIPAIGSIVSMILLYTNTPATAQTAWDNMFGAGAWTEIQTVAADNGWTTANYGMGVNWDSTFKILIPAYFAYGGSEATVYWGSEVKEPRKSMLIGTVVGPLLMWVFYSIFVYSVYYCYGDFVSQAAFVMMEEGVAGQLTLTPTIPEIGFPAFVSVFAPEPWLVFFISLTSALWIFGVCVLIMGMVSKLIFAMSFDRFVPEGLASVNDRFHSPHWALTLTFICAIIGLIIFIYYGALAAIVDTTIIW